MDLDCTDCHPAATSPKSNQVACPKNNQIGLAIDGLTVQALLNRPLNILSLAAGYRFCPDSKCPIVYYRLDGQQLLSEDDLRERVFQKHPESNDTLICYCFSLTVGDIRADIASTGGSGVIQSITSGIKAGQCACQIRNPQGSCCLGNVRQFVEQFTNRQLNNNPAPDA